MTDTKREYKEDKNYSRKKEGKGAYGQKREGKGAYGQEK